MTSFKYRFWTITDFPNRKEKGKRQIMILSKLDSICERKVYERTIQLL